MRISNLVNDNGKHEVNQFLVEMVENTYFQSYETIIAVKDNNNGNITLSQDWDYSKTTSKHLYIWLRDYTRHHVSGRDDVVELIENGTIKVVEKINYEYS